jgi:hypothetical protein
MHPEINNIGSRRRDRSAIGWGFTNALYSLFPAQGFASVFPAQGFASVFPAQGFASVFPAQGSVSTSAPVLGLVVFPAQGFWQPITNPKLKHDAAARVENKFTLMVFILYI